MNIALIFQLINRYEALDAEWASATTETPQDQAACRSINIRSRENADAICYAIGEGKGIVLNGKCYYSAKDGLLKVFDVVNLTGIEV